MTDALRHQAALDSTLAAHNLLDNSQGQFTVHHLEQAMQEVVVAFCALNGLLNKLHGGKEQTLSVEDPLAMREKLLNKPL